ncbi:MAG: DUF2062 domain-containing protein [Candidatus Thiodiazotropha taylori]|uniref:DUF2062 domain-containing protein n=1 Tax=Candidatus Thiodiazotropha taylori TaxID=2792791 RepID=A0A9E4U546_9GAMM|nr:DUF2062 domain-containing protein [Candidatus Thiodiazotropha taylori]MCG7949572.1 DUF2062 domain-containing protein [Candidatus Thiodiazotropha taylori]MCG7954684.1 DUF2062 domain-containing protein [Candidatus Thiodiazotropha taylori]MCG7965659.1 DUF2062 domain-containing protein [Candidatus Thiodiazotropha taylori]MCG8027989.1 DUF2062 domain-containing protein [Candidatus Thiodiazotropha taylori]
MPKQLIKRLLPHRDHVCNHKHMQVFGDLLHDANLWHLNRHSVSGAFAVGLFMAFIPVPFQMVLAAAAAIFFRVNLPLSVALVWITNPITIPPMFYFAYQVGIFITGETASLEPFQFTLEWLQSVGSEILIPLILGSLVCATVSSILGYSLILWVWRWHAVEKWKSRRHSKQSSTSAKLSE